MRRRLIVGFAGLLATLLPPLPQGFASCVPPQPSQSRSEPPLEITQADLFAAKSWNSNRVSVLGFMLGMERRNALLVAQQNRLALDDERGQGCLKEKTCSVLDGNKYNGVDLTFDDGEVLGKISILAWRKNASKKERSVWIASKFRGATRQLVESYSDNLRIRTLGPADVMQAGKMKTPSSWRGSPGRAWLPSRRKFEYNRLGVTLVIDGISVGFSNDSAVEKLTIEFEPPRNLK